MNKWYKRDIDVTYFHDDWNEAPWETTDYPRGAIYPITFYEEVDEQNNGKLPAFNLGTIEDEEVHQLSKDQLAERIDREADLAALRQIPIMSGHENDIAKSNQWVLQNRIGKDGREYWKEDYYEPVVQYMDLYYNRDYRTIGEQYKQDLSYFYRFDAYYRKTLYTASGRFSTRLVEELFDQVVQDTKDEKRISESIFVTDHSMVYQTNRSFPTVRGMQYIRYPSGTNLPEGVELNKWYKRAVDVTFARVTGTGSERITWDTAPTWFWELQPLTPYVEITGGKPEPEPQEKATYNRYVQQIVIPVATETNANDWLVVKYKNVVPKDHSWYIFTEEPYHWPLPSDIGEIVTKSIADQNDSGEDIEFSPRGVSSYGNTVFAIDTLEEEHPAGTYTLYISNVKTKDGRAFQPIMIQFTVKGEE